MTSRKTPCTHCPQLYAMKADSFTPAVEKTGGYFENWIKKVSGCAKWTVGSQDQNSWLPLSCLGGNIE